MKEPKDILTKEFLEEHYVNQRKSTQTIARENGIKSNNSVQQAIKRHGLSRRSLKDSSHILTKEYLEEHYVRQNKSLQTIVEEIGFKRKSIVKDALIKHGIPVREHTKSKRLTDVWKGRRKHHTISSSWFASIRTGARRRDLDIDITLDYIWELFEQQNRKCAISGVELIFNKVGENKNVRTASLDRIDSEQGYVEGNVQWVHKTVNRMKSDLSDDEFINWCKIIYLNNET